MSQTIFNIFQKFLALVDRLIYTIIGLALLAFLWGVVKFLFLGSSNEKARTEGRSFMMYGILILFVMTSMWGLVHLMQSFIVDAPYVGDINTGTSLDRIESPSSRPDPIDNFEGIFENNLEQRMI